MCHCANATAKNHSNLTMISNFLSFRYMYAIRRTHTMFILGQRISSAYIFSIDSDLRMCKMEMLRNLKLMFYLRTRINSISSDCLLRHSRRSCRTPRYTHRILYCCVEVATAKGGISVRPERYITMTKE